MDYDHLDLTPDMLASYRMFQNFRRPAPNDDKRMMSIKFSADGERLVAASNKRTLELYNCNTGLQENYFHMYKHGMSVIEYMEASDQILVGSIGVTKGDFAVRELNMTKNQFATSYIGHQRPSVSLAVNLEQKLFVSGGFDKSALLFDFRIPAAQLSLVNLPSVPLVALHPKTDNLCAIGLEDNRIELHDLRFLHQPFTTFKFNKEPIKWINLKFSTQGDQLLISTDSSKVRIVNSFLGNVQAHLDSKYGL